MAWPGELAYLAASLTGKVMGLLNMDGIHDAIQILATGGSMPNLTPIPQQQLTTRSLRDPPNPLGHISPDQTIALSLHRQHSYRHSPPKILNIHTRACTVRPKGFS